MIINDLLELFERVATLLTRVSSRERRYVSEVLVEIETLCERMAIAENVDTCELELVRSKIQLLHGEIGRHLGRALDDDDFHRIEVGLASARALFWVRNITSRARASESDAMPGLKPAELFDELMDSGGIVASLAYAHRSIYLSKDIYAERALEEFERNLLAQISKISNVRRRFDANI